MRSQTKILVLFVLCFLSESSIAQPLGVKSLSFITSPKQNRLVFEVTESPQHRVFVMNKPPRLVIDIKNAQLEKSLEQPLPDHALFSRIRVTTQDKVDLRVVIDLKVPVTSKKFSLSSNNNNAHRLVVDLDAVAPKLSVAKVSAAPVVTESPLVEQSPVDDQVTVISRVKSHHKQIVIAIDAGHGGNDPGAKGVQGTEEKKVTFQIAKKLEALINAQSGMKAVLVRKGDYYVGLRERMKIARAAKADLFVSIHADAYQDVLIKGASVYTLSTTGASSEAARWLADSENSSDMVDISLHDKDDDLASTLFDLAQKDTREASVTVANQVLKSFINVSPLHKDTVQKAGFMVLKAPDIPSILVETAFISNPSEEQNLLSQSFQTKIARALFNGLVNYFTHASSSGEESLIEAEIKY